MGKWDMPKHELGSFCIGLKDEVATPVGEEF